MQRVPAKGGTIHARLVRPSQDLLSRGGRVNYLTDDNGPGLIGCSLEADENNRPGKPLRGIAVDPDHG